MQQRRDDAWLRQRPKPLMDPHEQEMARQLEQRLRAVNDAAAAQLVRHLSGKRPPRTPKGA